MMTEKDKFYLENILDSIKQIEKFLKGFDKAAFLKSDLHQNAVIRKLEIIGEATKRISVSLKVTHEDVAWRKPAGLRDVLIHDYLGIDIEKVWQTVVNDLPVLKKQIKKILDS